MQLLGQATHASHETTPRHIIIGTAGHIDHGKTRLVEALTGINADRLPEERRRGMTIELGFARLTIDEQRFGIVDVPGHERFVRTMVAGATGIDMALLVVAADDSVMPQTVEHADVLHLLGVERAIVAINKIDTVEPEMVDLVTEDVRQLLSSTPMKGATICPVSAATGAGIGALKDAIRETSAGVPPRPSHPPFRMAVDRVFAVKGRGTVVTGSVLRGSVTTGDSLEVWPGGHACRVRDLQSHGEADDVLACGQRAAINISGIDRTLVQRGSELATPGYLQHSNIIGVRVHCLRSCSKPVKSASVVRLGVGTRELPARAVFMDRKTLEPGESALAQLRMGEPIAATYGQRFILRDETSSITIGGGAVLQPVVSQVRRTAESAVAILQELEAGHDVDRIEQVLRSSRFTVPSDLRLCARAGVELHDIPNLYGALRDQGRWITIEGTDSFVVPGALEDLFDRLGRWLRKYHDNHVDEPGKHIDSVLGWLGRIAGPSLARPLLDRAIEKGMFKHLGAYVCLPEFAPSLSAADEKLLAKMVSAIRAGGFQPPSLENLETSGDADRKRYQRLAKLAVALGELVQIDAKMFLHHETERELRSRVSATIGATGGASVSEIREELRSSRKYVVPFLEYLDRIGFTRRIDDRRVLVEERAV